MFYVVAKVEKIVEGVTAGVYDDPSQERGYRDRKGTVRQAVITSFKEVTFRSIVINGSRDRLALEEKNGVPQSLTN